MTYNFNNEYTIARFCGIICLLTKYLIDMEREEKTKLQQCLADSESELLYILHYYMLDNEGSLENDDIKYLMDNYGSDPVFILWAEICLQNDRQQDPVQKKALEEKNKDFLHRFRQKFTDIKNELSKSFPSSSTKQQKYLQYIATHLLSENNSSFPLEMDDHIDDLEIPDIPAKDSEIVTNMLRRHSSFESRIVKPTTKSLCVMM